MLEPEPSPPLDVTLPENLPKDIRASFNPARVAAAGAELTRPMSAEGLERVLSPSRWGLPRDPGEGEPVASPSPFTLRRIVGRGGHGEVWEAVQCSLGRLVAVKRLRSDIRDKSGSSEVTARLHEIVFRQEALTTACLDHPNIVPIYDLGIDESGQPLLAMKMVQGEPWHERIAREWNAMPISDFLAAHIPILISVAQAAAFAHSRGIVHRDLKPSQVMVGEYGEALLMDWGLAVVFDVGGLKDSPIVASGGIPLLENAANPSGTVGFMAPEQTERTACNIGPWTDVYLLGGSLYYLLTGEVPHVAPDSRTAFFRASRGIVDPPRTRTRREIPQELEDICMKALAARREDRHPSARALIEALQQFLSGSTKRFDSSAITSGVAERLAKPGHDYRAFGEMVTQLGDARALWPENPEVRPLRERALSGFSRFAIAQGDLQFARVQAERMEPGQARFSVIEDIDVAEAKLAAATRQRRRALYAVRILLVTVGVLAILYAVRERASRARLEELNASLAAERDAAKHASSRAAAARADAEGLVSFMLGDLSEKLTAVGQSTALSAAGAKAIDYFDRLPPEELSDDLLLRKAEALRQIGHVGTALGEAPRAKKALQEALAINRRLADARPGDKPRELALANIEFTIGDRMLTDGDVKGALAIFEEAAHRIGGLLPARPGDADILLILGRARNYIGFSKQSMGDLAGARVAFEEYKSGMQAIVARDGSQAEWQTQLAESMLLLGRVLRTTGDTEGALREFKGYQAILKGLAEREPSNLVRQRSLSLSHVDVGRMLQSFGDLDGALVEFHAAVDIRERLVRETPENMDWKHDLASALGITGGAYRTAGRLDEAIEHLERARTLLIEVTARDPSNRPWLADLSTARSTLAPVLLRRGRGEEAEAELVAALASMRASAAVDPKNTRWRRAVAGLLAALSDVRLQLREPAARENAIEAVAIMEELLQRDPANTEWKLDAAGCHIDLGRIMLAAGEAEAARRHAEGAFAAIPPPRKPGGPRRMEAATVGARAALLLGRAQAALGEASAARESWSRGLDDYPPPPRLRDGEFLSVRAQLLLHLGRREEAARPIELLREQGWRDSDLDAAISETPTQ